MGSIFSANIICGLKYSHHAKSTLTIVSYSELPGTAALNAVSKLVRLIQPIVLFTHVTIVVLGIGKLGNEIGVHVPLGHWNGYAKDKFMNTGHHGQCHAAQPVM
jgi:hypothetical protein